MLYTGQFWRLWPGKKRQDRERGESLGETDVISIYIYINKYIYISVLNHIEHGLSMSHLVRIDHEVILRPTNDKLVWMSAAVSA